MNFKGNKELLKNILTVILSTVLSLFLAEGIVRVYIFGWDGLRYSKMRSYVSLKDSELLQSVIDGPILYELKPNLNTTFRFNSLKTSQQGLRDENYAYENPQNDFRIAAIGDSYTMGWGVERGASYPDRLQDALNSINTTRFEVINFGVPGYNLQDYLQVLSSKALAFQPDLILIGFCEKNDFKKPVQEVPKVTTGNEVKRNGFYRSYLTVFIKKIIRAHKSPTANLNDKDSAYIKHTFKKLGNIAKNTHTPIGIVYLSLEPQEQGLQVIKQLANNNNLFFINASEEFTRLNGESYVIDKLDSHPNEEAHKIFTEAILKDTVTRLILDEKTRIPQALDAL